MFCLASVSGACALENAATELARLAIVLRSPGNPYIGQVRNPNQLSGLISSKLGLDVRIGPGRSVKNLPGFGLSLKALVPSLAEVPLSPPLSG
jgi:hypothetical protein